MGNGYRVPADDSLDKLSMILRRHADRVSEVEMPTGTQVFEAMKRVQELISDIGTYVDAYLGTGFTTGSMTATGNVSVGGTIGVTGTSSLGLINSLATYSRNVTGSGSYRIMYVNTAGEIGYVPSSLKFKQDIEDATYDVAALRQIRPRTYRYTAAVEELGDAAPHEHGVIVNELETLGLSWLIDYDEETGEPAALRQDRTWIALLALIKDQEQRIANLEAGQAQTA